MIDLIDSNRKNRVHVVNVYGKDDKFFIVLSDKSEMSWNMWINGGREDLRKA